MLRSWRGAAFGRDGHNTVGIASLADVSGVERGDFILIRSPKHLAWVRSLGCGIPGCREGPIHAHHVRTAATAGTGVKPSDASCVQLCWRHHAEGHNGGWKSFERKYGVDLATHAMWLAAHSPDPRIRETVVQ